MSRPLVDVGDLDRATYLGGGDIAAIMGFSPWRTPLDVYLAKIGQAPPPPRFDPEKERRLLRGKRMEPYVVQMLEEDHGITIVAKNARYRDADVSFMAAEIDFEWHDSDARVRNGEIKTTSIFPGAFNPWGDAGTDEIPIYYASQGMYGLGITGRDVCQYGVMFGMDNLVLYALERDDETIGQMKEAAVRFWIDHVEARIPPPPMTLADVAKLWPVEKRKSIEATPEIEIVLANHRRLGEDIKATSEAREEAEFHIKEFFGDHAEVITKEGRTLATLKAQSTISVDQKLLKATSPEVYEAFARTSSFRVLRHKAAKK